MKSMSTCTSSANSAYMMIAKRSDTSRDRSAVDMRGKDAPERCSDAARAAIDPLREIVVRGRPRTVGARRRASRSRWRRARTRRRTRRSPARSPTRRCGRSSSPAVRTGSGLAGGRTRSRFLLVAGSAPSPTPTSMRRYAELRPDGHAVTGPRLRPLQEGRRSLWPLRGSRPLRVVGSARGSRRDSSGSIAGSNGVAGCRSSWPCSCATGRTAGGSTARCSPTTGSSRCSRCCSCSSPCSESCSTTTPTCGTASSTRSTRRSPSSVRSSIRAPRA